MPDSSRSRLTDEDRAGLAATLPLWTCSGEVLRRTVELPSFAAAVGLVVTVGFDAEAANHHPDIDIRWRRVTFALTTHDAGGLTGWDVAAAQAIDARVAGVGGR